MPFQYTPYQNRYVGSIADLMGRGRDAEAQALITAANAQAQAAQVSGQAWGGAIQGIGNTIAAIPGQMQAQQQAQQDRDLVMEQRERADQARALRADIFNPTPAHTIGPVIPEGTRLSPTTPGAPVEGPNSMAGDWDAATGLELPNRYRTTDSNGSDIFDLEQIIATFASAGLDPPDMSPYIAINQDITGRFDQSLLNARGIARSLLEGPAGAWEQGLSTALGVFEANGLLPAQMLSSMRAQLQDIGALPAPEKEARLGQLLHQLTGEAAPETKFVSPDAVAVRQGPGGEWAAKPVTSLDERPRGAPDAVSIDGVPGWVWWDPNGIPRDNTGAEITGDVQPSSAAERAPTPGGVGDLALTQLNLQEERLGRPLTNEEKATTLQQVLDRNREGQVSLLPGQLSPATIEMTLGLMNSLRADPIYKGMVEINGGWQALQAAYAAMDTGLSDIAMINSFQRMIDPGATVREGDVTLMQTAIAMTDRWTPEFLMDMVSKGAKLPTGERARMLELGKAIYAARLEDYQSQTGERFEALATAAGVPFDLISGGFQPMPDSTSFRWED